MRLIDADELKDKLLKMQKDIINEGEPKENAKSDTWKAAYLLVFDEYIKMLDEMPSVLYSRDADAILDAILDAYDKGYSKGREDILKEQQLMKDYCKNDCDTIYEAYNKAYLERDKND